MMRRVYFITLSLILAMTLPVSAEIRIGELPDHTMLWNKFENLVTFDIFVIGASDQGILVCKFQDSVYVQVNEQFADIRPVAMRIFDEVLVIHVEADSLIFMDLTRLPKIVLLGSVNPGMRISDFALNVSDLYLSNWFDGLFHYKLNNYGSVELVDSSMLPILPTQLEVYGDTLYVLDEYNGILRYDLSAGGLNEFISYLFISEPPSSFLKLDSTYVVATDNGNLLFGKFGGISGNVVDSLTDYSGVRRLFATDSLLVAARDRSLDVVDANSRQLIASIPITNHRLSGGLTMIDDDNLLLLPKIEGGFSMYNLDNIDTLGPPRLGAARGGPVTDILLYNDRLYTGGGLNPVDVYTFDIDGTPQIESDIYPSLDGIGGLERIDDSLFVLYLRPMNRIFVYDGLSDPGPPFQSGSVATDSLGGLKLFISDEKFDDSTRLMFAYGNSFFDVYTIPDSGEMIQVNHWQFGSRGRITDFALFGSLLFVATNKGFLQTFLIDENFELEQLSILSNMGSIRQLVLLDRKLLVMKLSQMDIIDFSLPRTPVIDTTIELSQLVLDAKVHDGRLYTVGEDELAVFDLSMGIPQLLARGGRGGAILDVDDKRVAVSNGSSIDIYSLDETTTSVSDPFTIVPSSFRLLQNHPNPFNAATSIKFSLTVAQEVELTVFNLLGQEVTTLISGFQAAGDYSVEWQGTDDARRPVASGVYLYRLKAGGNIESRKMVLLK